MGIRVKDIQITLPDGIEQVGEPVITGKKTAKVTLKATKQVNNVKVSASYKAEPPVETEQITNVPVVSFEKIEYSGQLVIGETVIITSTFDKPPYIDLYKVEITGEGFTEVQAPQVSGNTIVSKYKMPDKKNTPCTVKASYNGREKELSITSKINE